MPAAPSCPRCGYDLSGDTATWERQCPLAGRCPECGLDFEWAHVASDRLRPPRWSYEHAIRRWPLRVPGAWCAACTPRRFWTTLRLEHPVRTRRIVVIAVLALAAFYVLSGLAAMLAAARADLLLTPVFPGFAPMTPGPGPSLLETAWRDYRNLLLTPFLVWDSDAREFWRGPFGAAWLATLAAAAVAFPLSMLLLPETFRMAKVRRVHILRGFAHTLPVVLAFALAGVLLSVWKQTAWVPEGVKWGWLAALPGIAWTTRAWRCIIRDYLRLPHARAAWLALALVALLASAIVAALTIRAEMHILVRSWRL